MDLPMADQLPFRHSVGILGAVGDSKPFSNSSKGEFDMWHAGSREAEKTHLSSRMRLLLDSIMQLSDKFPGDYGFLTSIHDNLEFQGRRGSPNVPNVSRHLEAKKAQEILVHAGSSHSPQRALAIPRGPRGAGRRSLDDAIPQFTSLVELTLLSKIQSILEEAMYFFGKIYVPVILDEEGWDCPQAAELTAWIGPLRRIRHAPPNALAPSITLTDVAGILQRMKPVRNAAVHRSRLGIAKIMSSLLDAQALTKWLKDEARASQLQMIQHTLQKPDVTELRRILGLDNITTGNQAQAETSSIPSISLVNSSKTTKSTQKEACDGWDPQISANKSNSDDQSVKSSQKRSFSNAVDGGLHFAQSTENTLADASIFENSVEKRRKVAHGFEKNELSIALKSEGLIEKVDLTGEPDGLLSRYEQLNSQEVIDLTGDSDDNL